MFNRIINSVLNNIKGGLKSTLQAVKPHITRIGEYIILATLFFIVINLIIITPSIKKYALNKPYSEAKSYMVAATVINKIYVIPLSKLGWKNPLTWPFYTLRDTLYRTGLSKFPENEGEKEIWWYYIRFDEYMNTGYHESITYSLKKGGSLLERFKQRYYPRKDVKKLREWEKELYEHIFLLADAKVSDYEMQRLKLFMVSEVAKRCLALSDLLFSKMEQEKGRRIPIFFKDKQVRRVGFDL